MPDFLLCLESKTEPSMAKAQNYRGGDTAHTFLISGTNGVGTPHNFERKHILGGGDTAHTLLGWGHRTTLRGGFIIKKRENFGLCPK